MQAVEQRKLELSPVELEALQRIDWSEMSDDELLVRVRGAYTRDATHAVGARQF